MVHLFLLQFQWRKWSTTHVIIYIHHRMCQLFVTQRWTHRPMTSAVAQAPLRYVCDYTYFFQVHHCCDFDMRFTFMVVGQLVFIHDMCILNHVLANFSSFLMPPKRICSSLLISNTCIIIFFTDLFVREISSRGLGLSKLNRVFCTFQMKLYHIPEI